MASLPLLVLVANQTTGASRITSEATDVDTKRTVKDKLAFGVPYGTEETVVTTTKS